MPPRDPVSAIMDLGTQLVLEVSLYMVYLLIFLKQGGGLNEQQDRQDTQEDVYQYNKREKYFITSQRNIC